MRTISPGGMSKKSTPTRCVREEFEESRPRSCVGFVFQRTTAIATRGLVGVFSMFGFFACAVWAQDAAERKFEPPKSELSRQLRTPLRLEADGKVIDIGELSKYAHAGPSLGDIDGDGDNDMLVGDFPGYFWHFENVGSSSEPRYEGRGKFMAGGEAAKTPIY